MSRQEQSGRRRTGNDDDLIRAVAGGDAPAFAEIQRRHRPWVTRLLISFTRNADEAQDLTQEVFTRVYRHAATYRTRGGFVAWVRRIAMNTGNTYLQQRQAGAFVPLTLLEDTPSDVSLDPLLTVVKQSLQTEIYQAITGLPDEQRDALLLRCFLGLTVPEIARRQNCPEGTVKSRLSHGLRRVRARLTNAWENE